MKTLRIRACHDAELSATRVVVDPLTLDVKLAVLRPAFVGSPRSVLWWWNNKPVVFTGDLFFPICAVKSWITVKI
jgi:hypothetical protein